MKVLIVLMVLVILLLVGHMFFGIDLGKVGQLGAANTAGQDDDQKGSKNPDTSSPVMPKADLRIVNHSRVKKGIEDSGNQGFDVGFERGLQKNGIRILSDAEINKMVEDHIAELRKKK